MFTCGGPECKACQEGEHLNSSRRIGTELETFTLLRSYLCIYVHICLCINIFAQQEIDMEAQELNSKAERWLDFLWLPTHFAYEEVNTSIYFAVYLVHDLCLTDGLRQPFLVLPGFQGMLWGPTQKSPPLKASVESVLLHKGGLNSWGHFSLCEETTSCHRTRGTLCKGWRGEREKVCKNWVGKESIWSLITSKELLK